MKQWFFKAVVGVMLGLAAPAALAQDEEEKRPILRYEGYNKSVKLEETSSVLTWTLFFLLAAVALSVMFKNAKRTHLD